MTLLVSCIEFVSTVITLISEAVSELDRVYSKVLAKFTVSSRHPEWSAASSWLHSRSPNVDVILLCLTGSHVTGEEGVGGEGAAGALDVPTVTAGDREVAATDLLPADGAQLALHHQPRADTRADRAARRSASRHPEVSFSLSYLF